MSMAFTGYATHKGMLRDGTLRIMIEVPQEHAGMASQMLVAPDTPVAVALLDSKADLSQNNEAHQRVAPQNLGEVLHRTGYFYHRPFLDAIASDDEFLSWVRSRPCAVCKLDAPSEAAHVRRIASGAGVGIKPQFSAIPLCRAHHQAQHQHGESAIGGRDAVDKMMGATLRAFGHERLKHVLGVDSLAGEDAMDGFVDFCASHDLMMPGGLE